MNLVSPVHRVPPSNLEAEQALLGSILINNSALSQASEIVQVQHFADPLHGKLFDMLGRLIERGQVVSAFTLKTFAEADEDLKKAGGQSYIARLAAASVHVQSVADFARTVRECAVRRGIIAATAEAAATAYDESLETPCAEQIENLERKLYELADGATGEGFHSLRKGLTQAINTAEAAHKREGGLSGLTTGLRDVDAILGGLHRSDLVILAARPGMGKAQPLDARVLLRNGQWRAMGDLRLGDELASIDGRPSRVAAIFPRGSREVFTVQMSDGRKTEACAEHLWRIFYRSWDAPRVVDTVELSRLLTKVRFQGRLWVDSVSGHFGSAEALPVDPWLLGALLGDGDLSALRLSTGSEHVLSTAKIAVGQDFIVTHEADFDYRITGARGPTAQMRDALRVLGLWGLKSREKFIPDIYKQTHREARLQLIRGLMDTDGWVEKCGAVCFGTTSQQLAMDFQYLIRSIGGVCSVGAPRRKTFTYQGEKKVGLPFYVCGVSYSGADTLCLEPHKRTRVRPPAEGGWRRRSTVKSVTSARIAETACIRVTHPSSLYVTDDFIVTHNTALATNMAFAAGDVPVGFFSLEMSAEQLCTRIVAEQAKVSADRIRKGQLTGPEYDRVLLCIPAVEKMPLFIDDTPALTIGGLRTRARRLKRQHGLGLIVVDYLQLLVSSAQSRKENRVQEVSEITRGLKALAKELDVPVLALSQLNRSVEQRADKHPQLSDLRDSGTIEQDADVVMFIYREEYYRRLAGQDASDVLGQAELSIAKHRQGPTGMVRLAFDGPTTRFSDIDRSDR